MAHEFWLSDRQWAAIEPHLPENQPGARRVDDRRLISGIVHVLKTGCRWRDVPAVYGPPTTIYNRWHRWSQKRFWQGLFEALREVTPDDAHCIDSTTAKAHRSSAGGKAGRIARIIGRSRGGRSTKIHLLTDGRGRPLAFEITPGQRGDVRAALPLLSSVPPGRLCLPDTAYDANGLRQYLKDRGTLAVIPNNPTRKLKHPFDETLYRLRNRVERTIGQMKDWRRIATRYDKLSTTFASAVAVACVINWWC